MVLTIAMLMGAPAFGQASDRLEGAVPEEVKAFKESAARFNNRASEIRQDTRDYVDQREAEAKARLTEGYDAMLAELGEKERNQRDITVQRFNDFLSKYPDVEYASHVRFRLADLYFEIENEEWLERSKEYFARLNSEGLSLAEAEELEAQGAPKLDLSRPVALYKRIIADNRDKPREEQYERLDGVYLMLGFVYSEENAALPERDYPEPVEGQPKFDPTDWDQVLARKSELAKATFRELISTMPDSELADRAHLFLGNFLFDEGEFGPAVAEYKFVYDKGEDGPYYDESIYQLAWAHYKRDEYDKAVPLFAQVLDRSEVVKRDTGKESAFRTDAVRYMAFAFADQGVASSNALQVTQKYFQGYGARDYEWDVYVEMADVLVRYSRWNEAVDVYRNLQDDPRWVNRPENPEFQMQIVRLYGNPQIIGDFEASGEARLMLTSRYNEGTEWWIANRNNPEALATARGFIESSLGQVAQELRVRAQESGEPGDFLVAAEKYQEYLDKFPISDDYYEVQWLLADSLRQAGETERAVKEYEALLLSSRYHGYKDGALVFRLQIRNSILENTAPPDKLPEGSAVEKTYTTEAGKEIQVYALGEAQKNFIIAADAVLAHEFGEPAPQVPDFRPFISENRHALMYIPAQILHYHNRFDESRPRLEKVISEYPRKDEASYAAGLLVDSYLMEGDLNQVRKYTNRFATMVLGSADVADPEGKFRSTLEGTVFQQAKALAESEDSLAAADAFMTFLAEFPQSEYREFSLYNAAFYYQQGGKAEKANELYEQFLREFPTSETSEKLYFRIATLYESTLQLEKAVTYYQDLAKRFPNGGDTPDAVYNAAYLQTGLGRYRDAAEGLEKYGNEYPDRADAEKVYFEAGEQWEAVSERDGLAFYDRYLKKYGYTNPDNAFTALVRQAEIQKSQGNLRTYEKKLDEMERAFDQLTAEGKTLGPLAHHYAAMAAYRSLEEEYKKVVKGELTRNEDKDSKLLDDKKAAVKAFEPQAKAFAAKYNDFEYSSAALLLLAKAPSYLADLGLGLQCPKGYSEDDCFAYYDILEEKVFPQFRAIQNEIVITRLNELIQKAEELKRHSPAVDGAMEELNRINPVDYAAVKTELQGETDSTAPPQIRGVKARKPAEEVEGDE
ncbi:MAG: tetratricopeptide repeat protein [Myxococcota bacterium]